MIRMNVGSYVQLKFLNFFSHAIWRAKRQIFGEECVFLRAKWRAKKIQKFEPYITAHIHSDHDARKKTHQKIFNGLSQIITSVKPGIQKRHSEI